MLDLGIGEKSFRCAERNSSHLSLLVGVIEYLCIGKKFDVDKWLNIIEFVMRAPVRSLGFWCSYSCFRRGNLHKNDDNVEMPLSLKAYRL